MTEKKPAGKGGWGIMTENLGRRLPPRIHAGLPSPAGFFGVLDTGAGPPFKVRYSESPSRVPKSWRIGRS